jgi:hypothetical protein
LLGLEVALVTAASDVPPADGGVLVLVEEAVVKMSVVGGGLDGVGKLASPQSRQRDDCASFHRSSLVEVGALAFLATELDDAAEGAIGGVADQPKTTATVGAPLHAILPSLQFCNPLNDALTRPVDALLRHVLTYAFQG